MTAKHVAYFLAVASLCCGATSAQAAPADAPAVAPRGAAQVALARLVNEHVAAQRNFDQAKLRQITADEYIEVSPRGELDPQAKMLSFYAERPSAPVPEMKVTFRSIQRYADVGLVVATLTMQGPRNTPPRAMQVTYTARCSRSACKLLSAQYTPVR
jgi:hypothetical protein